VSLDRVICAKGTQRKALRVWRLGHGRTGCRILCNV